MKYLFFRSIRVNLLLLILISLLPALGIIIYLETNLLLFSIAFIIAVFFSWFLGDVIIAKRVNKIVDASRRLGEGNFKTRSGLPDNQDELGELGKAFDKMAEALEIKDAERVRAEENIKKVAEEWQATFDSIMDQVMILDNEYK